MNLSPRFPALLALTFSSFSLAACVSDLDDTTADGELLFGLSEEDVQYIQESYLPEQNLDQLREQLTAPFDCLHFGDLCTQVGREAAIEITEWQVEQALAGVPMEEVQAELNSKIAQASEQRRAREAELPDHVVEAEQFRGSGDWAIRTKGDYRLKVRNGVSRPLYGDRIAYTESKLQHQDWTGIWWAADGEEICANTGPNEQYLHPLAFIDHVLDIFIDSGDPVKKCIVGQNSTEQRTYHERLDKMASWWIEIYARGCGSGVINGITLGICAEEYIERI